MDFVQPTIKTEYANIRVFAFTGKHGPFGTLRMDSKDYGVGALDFGINLSLAKMAELSRSLMTAAKAAGWVEPEPEPVATILVPEAA